MNLRDFVVASAIDVTRGSSYDEAVDDIVHRFSIARVTAELLLDIELTAIDMNLYVEGICGVDQPDRTSCTIIHNRS